MKTPKDYAVIYLNSPTIQLPQIFKECQDEAFKEGVEKAVDLCAERAKIIAIPRIVHHLISTISNPKYIWRVDKESILNVKKELLGEEP